MLRKLLLLALLICPALAFAQTPAFQLQKIMGTPIDGPTDLAVDRRGRMYVVTRPQVVRLDSTGRFLNYLDLSSPSGAAVYVGSVAVDPADNVYVSVGVTGNPVTIRKLSPSGQQLLEFGSAGTGAGQFQTIEAMTTDAAGNLYVVDYDAGRLQSFTPQGTLRFGYQLPLVPGSSANRPKDVDVDAAGNIYLLEEGFAVTKLNPAGQLLARTPLQGSWPSYDRTSSLRLDRNGDFFVTASQKLLLKFSASGALLTYGVAGAPPQFSSSTRTPLARDAAGNLYATVFTHQVYSDHLYKLTPAGSERRRWGNLRPFTHVRQDEAGNVYVFDDQSAQVHKYNAAGALVLSFGSRGSGDGQFSLEIGGLALDGLGNLYVLETSDQAARVQKFNSRGQFLTKYLNLGTGQGYKRFSSLAVTPTGTMYLADYYGGTIRVVNAQGVVLPPIATRGSGPGQVLAPKAVAVDLRGNVYAADFDGRRVQQFSPGGQLLRRYGQTPPANPSVTVCEADMELDGAGNIYVVSTVHSGLIFKADGSAQWTIPRGGGRVSINRRGTQLLTMTARNDQVYFYGAGQLPLRNLISGSVYHDANANCLLDAPDLPLAGIPVVAEPGPYYGLTDETGSYVIAVDTGTFTVRPLLPPNEVGRVIQPTCGASPIIRLDSYHQTVDGIHFANQVSTTPYLRVDVASNRRRRCFRNTTTVSYVNQGFAPVANAAVTVSLPPEVVLVSAAAPYTRNAAGDYVFAVGSLGPGAGGSIVLQDSVVCGNPDLRGRTVCTRATISPPNTYPPPPLWNRASVSLRGRAVAGNQVRFVLRNTGTGAMTDSLQLRLYQNAQLSLQHRYALAAGDSLVLRVPATRAVVRLEAEQPAGHPTQRLASATVELRGLSSSGQSNPTMAQMPMPPPGPETAEDCQPILDSYDPNDKLVFPTGVTAQRYTPTGAALQYRVRFQNTGNDDAYRVEVVDTLAADLDLSTLRVEAASHPFRLSVAGRGRPVLVFTFDNINLPPSARNDAASNGFVQFSIRPRGSLPARALITNHADIYFDYNPPVRTDTTVNRIYDLPPVVEPAVALSYPAVLASPLITQLTPGQGRFGTLVTLTGQRFVPGGSQVRFNGVAAPVLSATATTLTVRVPAGAATGPVQVITGEGGGRSPQPFTVYQPPTLSLPAPAEGRPGTLLTLSGTNFSPLMAQDTVWFNGVRATLRQASATALQVEVPATATTGRVRVATLGGRVESTQDFTVWYPPVVSSFSPARAKAGDVLVLTGRHFAPADRSTVTLGAGTAPVLAATATELRVRVPASAESGPVQVQTPGGTGSMAGFSFIPAPAIHAFTPAAGSVGETVTLTGANFLVDGLADTITIGGLRAEVLSASATRVQVRVPFGASTGRIAAAGRGGRGTSGTEFRLVSLAPAEAVVVYPNPARASVTLDWSRADFALERVLVYDALGKLVQTTNLGPQAAPQVQLSFSGQRAGLYLLRVHSSRGIITKHLTLL